MEAKKNVEKIEVVTGATPIILIFDQFIRIIVLYLYNLNIIGTVLFWVFQVVVVVIFTLIFANLLSKSFTKKVKKQFKSLMLKRDLILEKDLVLTSDASSSYSIMQFIFAITSGFVTYSIFIDIIEYSFVVIFLSILFGFIYLLLSLFYWAFYETNALSTKILHVYEIDDKKEKSEIFIDLSNSLKGNLIEKIQLSNLIDQNELKIIKMTGLLKNFTSKADSYLLESVLLGALAFSGFLTLTATRNNLSLFKDFFSSISLFFQDFLSMNFSGLHHSFINLTSGENLFMLISIETLLCSIFFILVISIRLQLSKYIEEIDEFVKITTNFNSRVEEIQKILLKSNSETIKNELNNRINELNYQISLKFEDVPKLVDQSKSIAFVMSLFRNLGLIFFHLILVTSGLFFSYEFSLVVLILAFFTFFYRQIQVYFDMRTIKDIKRRHYDTEVT